ncbi:MAG: YmdB family metallophosphoesterase [Actinobacteria bacterium]|nr:YmdB family metallophosphoesterase [Actinomycetota bacterium]MCA1737472.1 YmdB family metallophosphoesterase [Actinomycetota bacterium]
MAFRLLFIGDVMGEAGCAAVRTYVPELRRESNIDAVVANGENSAPTGRGITSGSGSDLLSVVDFLTLGNHAFDAKGGREYVGCETRVVRPENLEAGSPGHGWGTFEAGGARIGVVNVQGRVFMRQGVYSPFLAADRAVAELEAAGAELILVDVHAEATSEKQAMGYHLAGKVQAVVGTHTHVPTADACILPGGTAYVTDVGMTGGRESVIGFSKEDFLGLFLGSETSRIKVAGGPAEINAVVIEVDVEGCRAVSIERVCG